MKTITDITITYSGLKIPQTPTDWKFRNIANHVCDLYLQNLNGYKPNKVDKIVLQLRLKTVDADFTPIYFGTICNIFNGIDEEKYHANADTENLHYLLNLLHNATLKASTKEGWDSEVFIKAYNKILKDNFRFQINLPEKKSKDGKIARPFIEKDLEKSYLKVSVNADNKENTVTLIDKKNTHIFDSIYTLSKKVKWFDNNKFGLEIKDLNVQTYYSLTDNRLTSNLNFDDQMMIIPN
ncbi:MAG: hypothetical protein K0S32_3577 [Bacteroidetes bacterium]|jgi:hypothetical protein|nr:hypothetical protein [Bacteroidota bacterium]